MKKVKHQIIGISFAQICFAYCLEKLHVITPIRQGWLDHPITNQHVAPVVEYQALDFVDRFVRAVSYLLMGKDGKALADQLVTYGVVQERERE
jgi:hypothetical protein